MCGLLGLTRAGGRLSIGAVSEAAVRSRSRQGSPHRRSAWSQFPYPERGCVPEDRHAAPSTVVDSMVFPRHRARDWSIIYRRRK